MINKKIQILLLGACLFSSSASALAAAREPQGEGEQNISAEIQKVIEQYKAYVRTVDPKVRDEIIEYRKKIAEINRQKRQNYQQLSGAAQKYLAQEQEYKKKLPVRNKKAINDALTEAAKAK